MPASAQDSPCPVNRGRQLTAVGDRDRKWVGGWAGVLSTGAGLHVMLARLRAMLAIVGRASTLPLPTLPAWAGPAISQLGCYKTTTSFGLVSVCRPGGIPQLTFVEEYLGEIHTPWRWFEIQASTWSWSGLTAWHPEGVHQHLGLPSCQCGCVQSAAALLAWGEEAQGAAPH